MPILLPLSIITTPFSFSTVRSNPSYAIILLQRPKMSSAPPKAQVIVECAKSGRSSCKKCSKTIAASAVRLGLVTRDTRGFDVTKWHHLHCLPLNSVDSTDSIKGFSSLENCDQEEIKNLMKALDGEKDTSSETKKELKVHRTDDDECNDLGESKAKKRKLAVSDEGGVLEIAISASDIKDKYKDATLRPPWKAFQTVIFLEKADGHRDSRNIAAFDFDGCLAKTSVKKLGADAWSLMYPSIPERLQSLYNDGYKLVIFTNESNIERWKKKRQSAVDSKIGRLENFMKLVKVPIQVFIACGLSSCHPEDPYRKPKTGMWRIMEKHFNSGLSIDMDKCFFVGDAAGRRDDHSDADIKFAEAVGLKFYLPEHYFNF